MNINYQLNANELDIKFIKSLKELFKNKEIIIHITDISDKNVDKCANFKDVDSL